MASRLLRALDRVTQLVAWAALILLLTMTSLPWLARQTGASTVAPPAAIPLLVLVVAWFVPYILRNGTIPRLTIPFLAFTVVALIATARAHFLDIPPFKGQTILDEEIVALITLGVGAAFYLILATWPRTDRRLRLTLQLLNLGGLAVVAWSLLQGYFIWSRGADYPDLMLTLQDWVSLRGLFSDRVTGLAYEPSWLAHQLNLLYLPYWLAASLERSSAQRLRLFGLSLENILLAGGILSLFLSFSRIGILAFLLVVTYLTLRGMWHLACRANHRLTRGLALPPATLRLLRALVNILFMLAFVLAYLAAMVGLVYGIGRFDSRLAVLFNLDELYLTNVFALTNQLAFAERVVYWATGWQIFNDYPFMGVGLGNSGFFFPDKMPPFGWELWETGQIFYRLAFLPNIKSLWARLLAETGLVGFSLFLTWLYVLWRSARLVRSHAKPLLKSAALAGELALVAFLVEGFSIDSFALPYLWVAMGLLTATADHYQLGALTEPQPTAATGLPV